MDNLLVCKSCSVCCTGTEIRLIPEDIQRWKAEERLDILLSIDSLLGESRQLMKKEKNDECIFFEKYGGCEIHKTKPYICKRFPTNRKHADIFGCQLANVLFPNPKD